MIVEILQIFDSLIHGNIHLLSIYFIIFVIIPSYIIKRNSNRYGQSFRTLPSLKATVIVPVNIEDYEIFEKCLKSINSQKPDQIIVSIDSKDNKIIDIAEKYGAEIIKFDKRVGKRKSLADGWLKARNDIIIHTDSDSIMGENCLEEITKPFNDPEIAGVSTNHTCIRNGNDGSIISYIISSIIEFARGINDRALNGNLIVVDGKCNAWRKDFLLKVRDKFLNEYWMNRKCEIGDDRFLSREALKNGYKTVFSEAAKICTHSQKSIKKFLMQQIRWRRSGTKFWIKDLIEGVRPSKLYIYKCFIYYMAPIIFPIIVLLDILFFRLELLDIKFSIMSIIIGTSLISSMVQVIYFGKILFPKYILIQGILGLFLIFPISIYGLLTINKQDIWMTR